MKQRTNVKDRTANPETVKAEASHLIDWLEDDGTSHTGVFCTKHAYEILDIIRQHPNAHIVDREELTEPLTCTVCAGDTVSIIGRIPLAGIRFIGIEGHDAPHKTFASWYDAGQHVRNEIAPHAPRGGGYDKTDIEVVFTDGEKWHFRLDVQHNTMPYPDNDNDVAQYVWSHLFWHAGLYSSCFLCGR